MTVTPSGGCTLSGSTATMTSATTDCTLTATQAGDSTYNAATPVVRTVVTDPRPIKVTADPGQSKVYSNNAATDPALTHQITSGSLVGTDTLTGALTRVAGETVAGSPYAINQGTLSAGNNYALTYVGANFTITKKELSVNADVKSKTYGATDPTLTSTLVGFVSGQNQNNTGVTGSASCSRTTGETVAGSPYTITCTPGTLDAPNYSFAEGTTANFTINRKQINDQRRSGLEDLRRDDPTAFTGVLSGFVNGEDATSAGVTGEKSCSRAPGETVAGSPYAITCTAGTLAADNYSFATGTTANFTINKKALSVNADPGTKVYGDTDPTFTASLSGFAFSEDAFVGERHRAPLTARAPAPTRTWAPTRTSSRARPARSTRRTTRSPPAARTTSRHQADAHGRRRSEVEAYGDNDPDFTATLNNFAFSEDETSAGVDGLRDLRSQRDRRGRRHLHGRHHLRSERLGRRQLRVRGGRCG